MRVGKSSLNDSSHRSSCDDDDDDTTLAGDPASLSSLTDSGWTTSLCEKMSSNFTTV